MRSNPIIIGIVGGVASGKSEVAKQLVLRGAVHISADELGHSLLNDDPRIHSEVVALLGVQVLDRAGKVDRTKIAAMVFGSDAESKSRRTALEAILHPAIRKAAEQRVSELQKHDAVAMIILDAPLLIEADWVSLCDEIVFVDTPLEMRQRLAALRGWTIEELERREAAQVSLDKKRNVATEILVNDQDVERLREKCDALFQKLMFNP
ncbi:MAG: dephospho-CoA kinase [Pirellulaceae bacterium]|nr:dephospho-CoA kinase [Pirellulaceae bacterium]